MRLLLPRSTSAASSSSSSSSLFVRRLLLLVVLLVDTDWAPVVPRAEGFRASGGGIRPVPSRGGRPTTAVPRGPPAVAVRPSSSRRGDGGTGSDDDDVRAALAAGSSSPLSEFVRVPKGPPQQDGGGDGSTAAATTSIDGSNGIRIQLDPLTEEEARYLRTAAAEIVNDKIAMGIDEIELMRADLRADLVRRQQRAIETSNENARIQGARLLDKIDQMTNDFLSSTIDQRRRTKSIADAIVDRSAVPDDGGGGSQRRRRGFELGSWGTTTDGAEVTVMAPGGTGDRKAKGGRGAGLLILADPSADPLAKKLVGPVAREIGRLVSSAQRQDSSGNGGDGDVLSVTQIRPTGTVPLGGDGADAILIFLTSYADAGSINAALDRVLRRTLDNNMKAPTQIFAISTLGTERIGKMPYSMQNLMGGGKLGRRRQMEEAIIQTVQKRKTSIGGGGIDYTICKLGDIVDDAPNDFQMMPGDVVDGPLSVETAAIVVAQAMVGRPSARNSTFSVVGGGIGTPPSGVSEMALDDAFLRLDGPELYREEEIMNYDALVRYVSEWCHDLASSGKGLTTPVRSRIVTPAMQRSDQATELAPGVQRSAATQLVFLPTATGKNYVSRDDERDRERLVKNSGGGANDGGGTTAAVSPSAKVKQDGGLEFVVEQMADTGLGRVRVKRCNYGDGVIVKELSEETILSKFKTSMDVWRKDHPSLIMKSY